MPLEQVYKLNPNLIIFFFGGGGQVESCDVIFFYITAALIKQISLFDTALVMTSI